MARRFRTIPHPLQMDFFSVSEDDIIFSRAAQAMEAAARVSAVAVAVASRGMHLMTSADCERDLRSEAAGQLGSCMAVNEPAVNEHAVDEPALDGTALDGTAVVGAAVAGAAVAGAAVAGAAVAGAAVESDTGIATGVDTLDEDIFADEDASKVAAALKGISISKLKLLDAETEAALIARAQSGNAAALDRLVASFMPLAHAMASKASRAYRMPHEDLRQEALLAITKAAYDFDLTRGFRFASAAKTYVRNALTRYVLDLKNPVRFGTNTQDRKIFSHFGKLVAELSPNGDLTHDILLQISERLSVPLDRVEKFAARTSSGDVSLDCSISDDGDRSFSESFADPESLDQEEVLLERASLDKTLRLLRTFLDTLSERERMILSRRYLTREPVTREVIGKELGISKARVGQIETRSIQTLSKHLKKAGIKAMVDVLSA